MYRKWIIVYQTIMIRLWYDHHTTIIQAPYMYHTCTIQARYKHQRSIKTRQKSMQLSIFQIDLQISQMYDIKESISLPKNERLKLTPLRIKCTLENVPLKNCNIFQTFFQLQMLIAPWVLTQKSSTWALIHRKFIVNFENEIIFEI